MTNSIIPFKFENYEVRSIVDAQGNPWFVARDVAIMLGYARPTNAVSAHCKRAQPIGNIGVPDSGTLQKQTLIIPESDLNRLINRSELPKAEAIQDWLCEEVIPSIRKTGGYSLKTLTPAEQNLANAQLAVEHERRMTAIEHKADTALDQIEAMSSQLQAATGPVQQHTVMGYAAYRHFVVDENMAKRLGKRATALTAAKGIPPIPKRGHQMYGWVGIYHDHILEQVFSEYWAKNTDGEM